MVYQIPRNGIADNAINASKLATDAVLTGNIANGAVTSDKLSTNAKQFETFSPTPTNQNLALTFENLNKFIYLNPPSAGNFYDITLPEINDTPLGYWVTFVTSNSWNTPIAYADVKIASLDKLNGIVDSFVRIQSIRNGNTSVTILRGIDGWIVIDYTTTSVLQSKNSNNSYDQYQYDIVSTTVDQKSNSELVYITSNISTYNLNSSPSNGSIVTLLFENIKDASNLVINAGGAQIMGDSSLVVNLPIASLTLTYVNNTVGWRIL